MIGSQPTDNQLIPTNGKDARNIWQMDFSSVKRTAISFYKLIILIGYDQGFSYNGRMRSLIDNTGLRV